MSYEAWKPEFSAAEKREAMSTHSNLCPCGEHSLAMDEHRCAKSIMDETRGQALARLRDTAASANARSESRTRIERQAMDQERKDG